MAANETFCTECQRVAYIADGARLECPVCSSPLLATIEEETTEIDGVEELGTAV